MCTRLVSRAASASLRAARDARALRHRPEIPHAQPGTLSPLILSQWIAISCLILFTLFHDKLIVSPASSVADGAFEPAISKISGQYPKQNLGKLMSMYTVIARFAIVIFIEDAAFDEPAGYRPFHSPALFPTRACLMRRSRLAQPYVDLEWSTTWRPYFALELLRTH